MWKHWVVSELCKYECMCILIHFLFLKVVVKCIIDFFMALNWETLNKGTLRKAFLGKQSSEFLCPATPSCFRNALWEFPNRGTTACIWTRDAHLDKSAGKSCLVDSGSELWFSPCSLECPGSAGGVLGSPNTWLTTTSNSAISFNKAHHVQICDPPACDPWKPITTLTCAVRSACFYVAPGPPGFLCPVCVSVRPACQDTSFIDLSPSLWAVSLREPTSQSILPADPPGTDWPSRRRVTIQAQADPPGAEWPSRCRLTLQAQGDPSGAGWSSRGRLTLQAQADLPGAGWPSRRRVTLQVQADPPGAGRPSRHRPAL